MVAKALIQALRADRDVIFYDQRGVGFSEPKMCPEEAINWGPRTEGGAERRAPLPEVAARCGDSMRRAGLDLAQYNSAVSARDLQDLRRALGHEQWNLFGHSYGSRLASVDLRRAASGVGCVRRAAGMQCGLSGRGEHLVADRRRTESPAVDPSAASARRDRHLHHNRRDVYDATAR
jgi:pimeloyl-ACP methyl ester carboxylesterase